MQIRQEEENYTERHDLHDSLRHLSDFHKFYLNFILQKGWVERILVSKAFSS
jgi:hypothetical protein